MSDDQGPVRTVAEAVRLVVLGWERYREHLARQLAIGTSEIIALGYLHHEQALTPREIAERLDLTSGSVTALLDRLEDSGYVSRQQNPDDRRSLLVTATPSGRHAIQWAYEQLDAVLMDALSGYPHLDHGTLGAFLVTAGEAMTQGSAPVES